MKKRSWTNAALILFLAVFCLNPLSAFAEPDLTSCDCPGIDPGANASCGPIPAHAQKEIYATQGCPSEWTTLGKSLTSVSEMARAMGGKATLKNPAEVLDYMSCYAERAYDRSSTDKIPPANFFCHFKTTLAPQIALAAKSAGLPFAVQACLYFRESKFHPDAKSPAGAMGYVQFMPDTIKQMNAVVGTPLSEIIQKIKDTEKLKSEAEENLTGKISNATRTLNEKNINYYDALITNWKAQVASRKVWDKYWEGTTPAPDIKLTSASVKCPQVAFALSVMKQTYDLNLLTGDYGSKFSATQTEKQGLSINKMNDRDSSILLGGAYNAGVAGLASRCGKAVSLDACLKKFPDSYRTIQNPKGKKFPKVKVAIHHETRNYMTSIRSCASKGSTEPMSGSNQKKCEDFKCKK